MSRSVRLSSTLGLPVDVVTESIAILAKRRAGKSYTARKLVEQLYRAGQQVVVVDPKGDWWGVRSAADGKAPGLPIVVLGGEHGDVPLEAGAGELVAQLVVEERVSVVLDLSRFRKHEVATFMTGFLEAVYRLKAQERFRTPVALVIDEADAIAPQRPQRGEERMLGAAEDLVRRGGQRGIGVVMITQRSAVLNKNVLTQVSIMIALRTIAPQDLAAMDAWIDVHGTTEQRAELMASLPSLPVGTAWVWAPGWPDADGIFQRIQVDRCETFDSGATPKAGERPAVPKTVADVDLDAFRRDMAATIERSKADDPKALRKDLADARRRIGELEKQVAGRILKTAAVKPEIRTVDVPILKDAHLARLEASLTRAERIAEKALVPLEQLQQVAGNARAAAQEIRTAMAAARAPVPLSRAAGGAGARSTPSSEARKQAPAAPRPRAVRHGAEAAPALGRSGKQRMLVALAQHPDGLTSTKLSILTGISQSGGTWRTYLSELRGAGWVEGSGGDVLRITDTGREALGDYEPLPTGAELVRYWQGRLGSSGKRRIFDVVVDAYPKALSYADVSAATGIDLEGGTWRTYVSELRGLELIEGRGELRASDALFEEASS